MGSRSPGGVLSLNHCECCGFLFALGFQELQVTWYHLPILKSTKDKRRFLLRKGPEKCSSETVEAKSSSGYSRKPYNVEWSDSDTLGS